MGHAVQQVNLITLHQALINTAHQTRLTFDLEIETTHGHSSLFRTRPHECRWQCRRVYLDPCPRVWEVACVVLWSSVTSQNHLFRPVGGDRVIVSVFYTLAAKCVFNRSLIGARHESPAVEWALYTKGGSEALTSSPRSEFTTMSLILSKEVCGEHEIKPRLIQDLLEKFSSRCSSRSPWKKKIRKIAKVQRTNLQNWAHRRPLWQTLAGIFGNFKLLAFQCHRSEIHFSFRSIFLFRNLPFFSSILYFYKNITIPSDEIEAPLEHHVTRWRASAHAKTKNKNKKTQAKQMEMAWKSKANLPFRSRLSKIYTWCILQVSSRQIKRTRHPTTTGTNAMLKV